MPKRLPMQPIKDGRFVKNSIVSWLLDNGGLDMNDIARQGFSPEDQEQFAQLIGYSVEGWMNLSYVSDEAVRQADALRSWGTEISEQEALIEALQKTLEDIRRPLRDAATAAFAVSPEDLSSRPGGDS